MINLLDERTERIQLKQESFKRGVPATDGEISDFELNVRRLVDPDITVGKYTKNDLKNNSGYKEFMNKHCRERNYIFQVRKCHEATCCPPFRNNIGQVPHFLPDPEIKPDDRDHYKPFSDVLGKETSETDMPSGQTTSVAKVAEDHQVMDYKEWSLLDCKCSAQLLLKWHTIQQPTSQAKICVVTVQTKMQQEMLM